ncbi:MAG TPA: TlpA disulfide reductase family protein [Bacteroidales bacterium]
MKKTIVILVFIVTTLLSNAQVDTAIVKGQVHTGNVKTINIEWLEDNPVYDIQKTYKAHVDSLGQFEFRIPVARVAYGRIAAGRFVHDIALQPSDNFFADISADTVQYFGKGAEKNNFLYFLERKGYQKANYYTEYNTGQLSLKEFAAKLADFRDKRAELLKQYTHSNNKNMGVKAQFRYENKPLLINVVNKEFINYFTAQNQSIYFNLLLGYPQMYAYKNKVDKNSLELPEEYVKYSTFKNLVNDSNVISDVYINTMNNLSARKAMDLVKFHKYRPGEQFNPFQTVLCDSLKGKTQEYVLAYCICSDLARDKFDSVIYKKYKQIARDPLTTITVKKAYNNFVRKKELVGNPLTREFIETEFEDTLGNAISFGKMMDQYKGKVVYLDIWGMYCGPCRALMPDTKRLKDKLANQPVEFVYLSIDRKHKNFWTEAVNVTLTNKNHYLLKNGFDSKFMQFMEINWVPCFMIFDKVGKLVDFSAPSPYDRDIETKLLKLAQEN